MKMVFPVAEVAVVLALFATLLGLLRGIPWPWALWTAAGGLLFGFLREKSGSVLAPAVAHGLFVLPTSFFSP